MTWNKCQIGYCSNVHPGESSAAIENNINRFTGPIRQIRNLPVMQHGLWLGQQACDDYLSNRNKLETLKRQLLSQKLHVVTLNAFPVGNFHADRVKQAVYSPHWGEMERLDYTLKAAQLLASLLPPEESFGSISTLPLGYANTWTDKDQLQALNNLCKTVVALSELEKHSGKQIQLCLEMEPGCVLQNTPELLSLFNTQLPTVAKQYRITNNQIKRYLGVCYDVCHQAVMYENIEQSLQAIVDADINIGKIQISSALRVKMPNQAHVKTWLSEYAESRYLHQTTGLTADRKLVFSDDLELALTDDRYCDLNEWRVHFHVPVHKTTLGSEWIESTSDEINTVISFLSRNPECQPHLELETYSWNVLPKKHRPGCDNELVQGIQLELAFIESTLQQHALLKDSN